MCDRDSRQAVGCLAPGQGEAATAHDSPGRGRGVMAEIEGRGEEEDQGAGANR
jgi:hypothetical protein